MQKQLTGMNAVKDRMSLARLAREIGITRGAVAQWDRVPGERLFEVSRITGIPVESLRPDMFKDEPRSESAA